MGGMKTKNQYDVVVIGGGPSGMMSAGRAAELGARVLLLEKNNSLGKKLLLTGGGRCNVTNAEFNADIFLGKFGSAKKFLFSPLAQFGVQDTIDFFARWGVPTKVEAENRVFPVSDNSQSILNALIRYMEDGGVEVRSNSEVSGFTAKDGRVTGVVQRNGETISAGAYILAVGGKSHPETGSTGDGFVWLEKIGHTVHTSRPALVPLRAKERWARKMSGAGFAEAGLSIVRGGKKKETKRGKLLFTHFGLSGPLALNRSRRIGELLSGGEVEIAIDLFPGRNYEELDGELLAHLDEGKSKQIKNALGGFILPICIPVFLEVSGIDPERTASTLTRKERTALVRTLKDLRITITGLLSEEKAIVTSGGVELKEVDFRSMRSRLYPNLYFAGDILDIDRPSGGYSLQLCWTSGFVAGSAGATK